MPSSAASYKGKNDTYMSFYGTLYALTRSFHRLGVCSIIDKLCLKLVSG